MKLSVVIPAFNEERYLPTTLASINGALSSGTSSEVIVVDNQSTDATARIAADAGARLIVEAERNIGKVRNTGAAAAFGELIVFIDADTLVKPGVFEKIMRAAADARCLGGSVAVEYEAEFRRLWVRWFMKLWPLLGKLMRMRGGALQFCRADGRVSRNGGIRHDDLCR